MTAPTPPSVPVPLTVPVLVDGWQFACCGEPPAVGARVAWRLARASGVTPPDGWALIAPVEPLPPPDPSVWRHVAPPSGPPAPPSVPAVARTRGLSVYVETPVPVPATVGLTGWLVEDHHGSIPEATPRTTGMITRVRLVSWDFAFRSEGRYWEPVPGSERYQDEYAAPKFLPRTPAPDDTSRRRRQVSAVLVDLRVDAPARTSDGDRNVPIPVVP